MEELLEKIPAEIWDYIFSFLPLSSLPNAMRVSQEWKKCIEGNQTNLGYRFKKLARIYGFYDLAYFRNSFIQYREGIFSHLTSWKKTLFIACNVGNIEEIKKLIEEKKGITLEDLLFDVPFHQHTLIFNTPVFFENANLRQWLFDKFKDNPSFFSKYEKNEAQLLWKILCKQPFSEGCKEETKVLDKIPRKFKAFLKKYNDDEFDKSEYRIELSDVLQNLIRLAIRVDHEVALSFFLERKELEAINFCMKTPYRNTLRKAAYYHVDMSILTEAVKEGRKKMVERLLKEQTEEMKDFDSLNSAGEIIYYHGGMPFLNPNIILTGNYSKEFNALSIAVESGFYHMAQLLVDQKEIAPNMSLKYSSTMRDTRKTVLFIAAVELKDEQMVRLLLSTPSINPNPIRYCEDWLYIREKSYICLLKEIILRTIWVQQESEKNLEIMDALLSHSAILLGNDSDDEEEYDEQGYQEDTVYSVLGYCIEQWRELNTPAEPMRASQTRAHNIQFQLVQMQVSPWVLKFYNEPQYLKKEVRDKLSIRLRDAPFIKLYNEPEPSGEDKPLKRPSFGMFDDYLKKRIQARGIEKKNWKREFLEKAIQLLIKKKDINITNISEKFRKKYPEIMSFLNNSETVLENSSSRQNSKRKRDDESTGQEQPSCNRSFS